MNVYWLSRRLRECVECFGMKGPLKRDELALNVYHGLDKTFTFSSMFAYIKGPFSTTISYAVATNFGRTGMVLQFKLNGKWIQHEGNEHQNSTFYGFDCSWLSDYPEEAEIFNIGGLHPFMFENIIESMSGKEHKIFIKSIKQMSYHMGSDWATFVDNKATNKFEKQLTFRLLSHEIWRCDSKHTHAHKYESCPDYVKDILHEHCGKIKSIIFPENSASPKLMLMFKYDNEWIKLDLLTKVFPNLERIYFNAQEKDISFIQQKTIYNAMLSFIQTRRFTKLKYIEVTLRQEWVELLIKHPPGSNKNEFAKLGWQLSFKWPKNALEMIASPHFRLLVCKFGVEDTIPTTNIIWKMKKSQK
eukprot:224720_1